MINPSTTKSGVVPDLKLPIPRMMIFWAAPGSPLVEVTLTPEILPCNNCPGFATTPRLKLSLFKEVIAPVTSDFL